MAEYPSPPFRWDVTKRHQLGRLIAGWQPNIKEEFLSELLLCSARVLAFSDDGELHFVGRSLDSLFDLLSGLLARTSWENRLHLLPVSLRFDREAMRESLTVQMLRGYLDSLWLAPRQVASRERPAVLVDIVSTGQTFGELIGTWHTWASEAGLPWEQVRAKIRLIGITQRSKTSPNTHRWQQHVPWASLLRPRAIKNVSVPPWFWEELTERPKITRSFRPKAWTDPGNAHPSRDVEALDGLREALFFYETGRMAETRERFAALLADTPGMSASWFRSLLHELRSSRLDGPSFRVMVDDAPPAAATARGRSNEQPGTRRRTTSEEIRRRFTAAGIPMLPLKTKITSAAEFAELCNTWAQCWFEGDPTQYTQWQCLPADESIWAQVIEDYPTLRVKVAENRTVPASILLRLAREAGREVRAALASRRPADPELSHLLAQDRASHVRLRVAQNKTTPTSLLDLLVSDPNSQVAAAAKATLAKTKTD